MFLSHAYDYRRKTEVKLCLFLRYIIVPRTEPDVFIRLWSLFTSMALMLLPQQWMAEEITFSTTDF